MLKGFKASNGWLGNFKTRFNIKAYRPHGESGAADQAGISAARYAVPQIIMEGEYTMDNVHNMDESGLYFRAKPSKTLATGTAAAAAVCSHGLLRPCHAIRLQA